MLVIGLTGGIGSGKSTVANYFTKLGITVIDTDQIARGVVQPNTPALKKIQQRFGDDIVDATGHLDRKKLRNIVFTNPQERRWLEQLLHPLIRQQMKQDIKNSHSPYCIVVIPLLIESKSNRLINRILVVDAPEQQQISRTQQRDQVTPEHVQAIINSQASRQQRLAKADDVIHNDADLQHLQDQVQKLHQQYLKIANS